MADKIDLPDIGSLANSSSARAAINSNFNTIENAIDNTLSRDGSTPNQMEADIDLNGNSLLNVADPVNDMDGVNKRSIGELVGTYVSEIAETLIEGTARVDRFIATNGQLSFALTDSPGTEENMYVFDNGIAMTPNLDFHLTGTDLKTLTFFSPRILDAEIVARYVQLSPADGLLRSDLSNTEVSTKNAGLVGYIGEGTGIVARTVLDKLRDQVSVFDYIPTTLHAALRAGTHTADVSAYLKAAVATGKDIDFSGGTFYVAGEYPNANMECTTVGQRLFGNGTIVAIGGADGQIIRVTADQVIVDGLRFDGSASRPTQNQYNDIIRCDSADDCQFTNIHINGSQGGGICLYESSRCLVGWNYVYDVADNCINVLNPNSNDNLIIGNYLDTTREQNNIYISSDAGGAYTTAKIYRNKVIGNVCLNPLDTCIESGLGTVDTIVANNYCKGAGHPELLIRDCEGVLVTGNRVVRTRNPFSNDPAISVINILPEHADRPGLNSIVGNHITGWVTYGISVQAMADVTIKDNYVYETANFPNPTTGVGLASRGISLASSTSRVSITGNTVVNCEIGIECNTDGVAKTHNNLILADNNVTIARIGISLYNCLFVRSRISNNTIGQVVDYGIGNNAASSTSSRVDGNSIHKGGFSAASPVDVQFQDWVSGGWSEAAGYDSGWIAPTLLASWVNFGGSYATTGYRKVNGEVMLRGLIKNGTATDGTTLFTLPSGYRPTFQRVFKVANPNSPTSDTRVEILTDGSVNVQGSVSNTYLALDGIRYMVG